MGVGANSDPPELVKPSRAATYPYRFSPSEFVASVDKEYRQCLASKFQMERTSKDPSLRVHSSGTSNASYARSVQAPTEEIPRSSSPEVVIEASLKVTGSQASLMAQAAMPAVATSLFNIASDSLRSTKKQKTCTDAVHQLSKDRRLSEDEPEDRSIEANPPNCEDSDKTSDTVYRDDYDKWDPR
jgi:hypothetical protein